MPIVSVIIPTYNRSKHITKAIESILSQTLQNYEIIVVDDGSNDDTIKVLEKYMNCINYIYQENKGVSTARNVGLRESKGEYILFLDSDDYIAKDALEKYVESMESNPDAGWIYSRALVLNEQGKILQRYPEDVLGPGAKSPEGDIFVDLFVKYENFLPINAVVFRKAAIGTQLFDEKLVGYEDWDFWLRLAAQHKVKFIDEVLAFVTRLTISAQMNVVEFRIDRAKVIHKIQQMYPAKTAPYKRLLSKKAAGAHNNAASVCLTQGLLITATIESVRSIISHPVARQAYRNLGLILQTELTNIWSKLTFKKLIFKNIVPETLKDIYRIFRAKLLSIGLSRFTQLDQPENEIKASNNISVIVAIHDAPDVTKRCLNSIVKYGAHAEVILVDDGSQLHETKNMLRFYEQNNKNWHVVRNTEPKGHSRACEAGSRISTRPYLCFLNSDTVLSPWSWAGAVDAFEVYPEIAVTGPATSRASTKQTLRIADYCRHYWTDTQICAFAAKYISKQQANSKVFLPSVDGFAFFIRKAIWEEFGGFDPKLTDYGNETELCKRISKAGYQIVWTQNSYIHHLGKGSYGRIMSKEMLQKKQNDAEIYLTRH